MHHIALLLILPAFLTLCTASLLGLRPNRFDDTYYWILSCIWIFWFALCMAIFDLRHRVTTLEQQLERALDKIADLHGGSTKQ